MVGCEADSFLDPSVIGRWEYTPTVVPILERIDIIEPDTGSFVETSPPTKDDLIPEAVAYEVGPGDLISIEIFDLIQPDVPSQFDRVVDATGAVDLPQVGRVVVQGLTLDEIREAIRKQLRDGGIIADALVSVQLTGPRKLSFKIYGAISQPGRFLIAEPNYRLLDAITEGGGVSPIIKSIRVIRQVPLAEAVRGTPTQQPGATESRQEDKGTDLIDLIEQLSKPDQKQPEQPPAKPPVPDGEPGGANPSPALFASADGNRGAATANDQPETTKPENSENPPPQQQPPAIDLIDLQPAASPQGNQPGDGFNDESQGAWMFLNGKWVRVVKNGQSLPAATGQQPESTTGGSQSLEPAADVEDLVTQRVIEIPTRPLLAGAARFNIVIRPGDIIYVPPPPAGNIYVAGPGIARPGTYNLPPSGKITLTKAIVAAGGLSPIGIPERVDLTRMVGDAQQATIRLNLRAIMQGTQPDVFLKPDDVINVGTNFWAQPLAVIRNGFRASYGFGFLLDRNFGNDVFGAPPSNVGNPNQ